MIKHFFCIVSISLLLCFNVQAQQSFGGEPRSFKLIQSKHNSEVPIITLSSLNLVKLYEEDNANEEKNKPSRIGVIQKVDYGMQNSGIWQELPDGGKLWRLGFYSKDALALSVFFNFFDIPKGAELFVYNAEKDFIIGKFTSDNTLEDMTFYTQRIEGNTLILEYYEPKNAEKEGQITIAEIGIFYKTSLTTKSPTPGYSGGCEINVACTEGDNWRDQIRSIAHYETYTQDGNVYMCSGALINNTRQDKTQYFLSACHCQQDDYGNDLNIRRFVLYFNYQTDECAGSTGVKNQSVTGATIIAKNDNSDFLLMEITGTIPESYNVYYAGWDRSTTPTVGSCIHHPAGDWKKISIPSSVTNGQSDMSNFWKTNWITGASNKGVTEGGSSGAPLFNANKRIIGQLMGGYSSCSYYAGEDYYGKFSTSWKGSNDTEKSLFSWLDPDNTNVQYLDGISADYVSVRTISEPVKVLSIYPNPTKDYITIKTSFLTEKTICRVYNIIGEIVYSQELNVKNENTLNLSHLSKGNYIVEFVAKGQKYSAQIILTK